MTKLYALSLLALCGFAGCQTPQQHEPLQCSGNGTCGNALFWYEQFAACAKDESAMLHDLPAGWPTTTTSTLPDLRTLLKPGETIVIGGCTTTSTTTTDAARE